MGNVSTLIGRDGGFSQEFFHLGHLAERLLLQVEEIPRFVIGKWLVLHNSLVALAHGKVLKPFKFSRPSSLLQNPLRHMQDATHRPVSLRSIFCVILWNLLGNEVRFDCLRYFHQCLRLLNIPKAQNSGYFIFELSLGGSNRQGDTKPHRNYVLGCYAP